MSGSSPKLNRNNDVRVLVIAPTPFFADRGCHVHIAEQAWALQRQGAKITIVTYGLGRDLPGLNIVRTPRLPWYRKLGPGPSWHKFYLDPWLLLVALITARKFRPTVIHSHLHEGCLIGWVVSRLFDIPLVFDCQGSLTGELLAHRFPLVTNPLLRHAWYALERWIDHRADAILAQSDSMRRELCETFGVPEHRLTMAYDGVNTAVFAPSGKNQQLLNELHISPKNKVIVFLGVLTPYQGVDDLLSCFPEVLKPIPDAVLVIMGYPNVEHYRRQAERLGITHAVRFTGRVPYEKAAQYLALGDIAVSPKRSQTEANGKIYNYMACGLPTVAFDTVVNRNILGNLGVYVGRIGDVKGLTQAMVSLLGNENQRRQLAEQVRQRAVKTYSWNDVARRILRAYAASVVPWQLRVFAVSVRKKEKWRWVSAQLTRFITTTSRCLDVGCGVGTLGILSERLGGQWEWLEPDAATATEARTVLRGPVLTADINDGRLLPHSYNIITLLDVIEHVSDPIALLKRAEQLLQPEGFLLVTTPADDKRPYFWRRAAQRLFGITKETHGHVIDGFSLEELQQLAKQTSLSFISGQQFSFFFTEMVELGYNGAYLLKNKPASAATGYNFSLSPASTSAVIAHRRHFKILRLAYPFLRGLSLLDRLPGLSRGYEWGVVMQKQPANSSPPVATAKLSM